MSKICLICEESEPSVFTKCTNEAFDRIKEFANLWSPLKRFTSLNDKISTITWVNETYFFHRTCYGKLTHKTILERELSKNTPRQGDGFALCILCQNVCNNDRLSTISSIEIAQEMIDMKMKGSPEVKIRLSSVIDYNDILRNHVKYHSKCLLAERRKSVIKNNELNVEEDKYREVDNEFITEIKHQLTSLDGSSPTIDVKQLVAQYEMLTEAAKLPPPAPVATMRHYVRSRLECDEELMSKIDFHHFEPCKPTVVANKLLASKLVCEKHFQKEGTNQDFLLKTSCVIRKELSSLAPWQFDGSFENFEKPEKLVELIKLIIADSHPLSEKKQNEVDNVARNIAEYIYSNFKTDRQLKYKSETDRSFEKHRPTPLSVGMALVNYQQNRSKGEIEFLSNIGLSINYDKVERIVTGIASTLIEQASKTDLGIVLPSCIKKGIRPVFAADNIDMGSDAGSFHGADLMIVQRNDHNHENVFQDINFQTKSQKKSLTESIAPKIDENVALTDDNNTKYTTATSLSNASQYWKHFEQLNLIWLLQSCFKLLLPRVEELCDTEEGNYDSLEESDSGNENENHIVSSTKKHKKLSWSAFHSKISQPPDFLSNVEIVAPLYRRSPTEVPILMDILKRAMNINALIIGEGGKTIITLDGDLYARAVKVPNYKQNWIIRLGSLHTIIAALKCLGKYIEGSGIDTAWNISGIYGSATINQIIDGRHIYRGIHAHTITLIALYHLYSESTLSTLTATEKETLNSVLSNLENQIQYGSEKLHIVNAVLNVKQKLIENGIFEKLNIRQNSTNTTATFLCNYMLQVMNLLNYIGATRNRNWNQHLATTDEMSKYFHAHDQLNYAKWILLYLADMLELLTTDLDSWNFLAAGNFTVSKNKIPFTSIDPDHAIEHEHRPMKMKGGFTGIANNEPALNRFCVTAPVLSKIAENFERCSRIKPDRPKQQVHHELVGNLFVNQLKQSQNLISVLSKEGNPFEYPDLRNLMSFSVPRSGVCSDVINRDKLGEKCVAKFRKERMEEESEIPFWSTLKRNNFQMFSNNDITVNIAKKTVTSLKAEKLLYARMLMLSKTRPDLCPERIIGEYEFTNIPPSNFFPDGTMITAKSNETLIKLIQGRPESTSDCVLEINRDSAIIIDAMDIIILIKKRKFKNVAELASAFMSELEKISESYLEVRLIFSRFTQNSWTESCGQNCNFSKKGAVQYHVNNNTPIRNVESFLAHVKTRIELSEFLGQMVIDNFDKPKLLVAYGKKFYTNGPDVSFISGEHSFEDVKHMVLLNAVDVSNKSRLRKLAIKSESIDTLMLLVGFYQSIPPATTFIFSGENIQIASMYSRLGKVLSEALIGWYAFQGNENQGAFFGKGITSHFRAFEKSDDDIINAFSNFGISEEIPESIFIQMQRYICLLYGNDSQKNIKELRYTMSLVEGKDSNEIPPTSGTLIPHVSRAYYNALIGKIAVSQCPEIPVPTNYYWTVNEDFEYSAVMCINPPSPASITKIKKCSCKSDKKRCVKLSCTCFKNQLKCCGLCGCGDGCQNIPENVIAADEGWDDLLHI